MKSELIRREGTGGIFSGFVKGLPTPMRDVRAAIKQLRQFRLMGSIP